MSVVEDRCDTLREGFAVVRSPGTLCLWDREVARVLNIPANKQPPVQLGSILPPLAANAVTRFLENGSRGGDRELLFESLGVEPGVAAFSLEAAWMRGAEPRQQDAMLVIRSGGQAEKIERLGRLASLGLLSASLAHEIKNSLVAIKTFMSTVIERDRGSEMAELAGGELERINSIASRMLGLSSGAESKPKRLDLHSVLEQTIRIVRHEAAQRGVRVRPEFFASDHELTGSAQQLEQAFLNLFLNAIAAMDCGGELHVVTENVTLAAPKHAGSRGSAPISWIRLRIADSGNGIAPENLGHVFDPFFTTKPDGTGLGLSITRGIVEEHGGRINVESTVGVGTTFRLFLPVAEGGRGQGSINQRTG